MHKYMVFTISILLVSFCSYSETYFRPMKRVNNAIWKADSFFVGAGLKTISNTNIKVKKIYSKTEQIGKLYYVNPTNDSLTFLFNNKDTIQEAIISNLINDSPITFLYIVNPIEGDARPIYGKKLYTGQNRENTDKYISEISNGAFGRIWAIAGQIDSTTVQVGFEANGTLMFQDIIFLVSNAKVQK